MPKWFESKPENPTAPADASPPAHEAVEPSDTAYADDPYFKGSSGPDTPASSTNYEVSAGQIVEPALEVEDTEEPTVSPEPSFKDGTVAEVGNWVTGSFGDGHFETRGRIVKIDYIGDECQATVVYPTLAEETVLVEDILLG